MAEAASGPVMVPWLGIDEETFLQWAGYIMIGSGVVTFVASQATRAPYGRYSHEAGNMYGPPVPARLAWMLQECPSVFVPLICLLFGSEASLAGLVNRVLVGLFLVHYIQRSFVFPFLIRGGKPTPAVLVLMAFVFCLGNGYMQGRYHTRYAVYADDWVYDPRFIVGIILFFAGMFINIQADSILRNLRKPGETAYKIPRGGMFEYVSGANFFGEILEWTGFALASWSVVAFAFAFFTFSNTGPRGVQHHQWYQKKFNDYPKTRKGVIPFVW